jgi:hypothetical protein
MGRVFLVSLSLLIVQNFAFSQEGVNVNGGLQSAGAGKSDQMSAMPVNFFTGVPNISFPLFSYSNANNGLRLDVSISYFAGGTRVLENPTTVGLGWSLNAGGMVTRTVRGMPDDIPTTGFMQAGTIATDYRSNAGKYYYDSLDSQPDIFSFSCPGGSGKFYIGKDSTVVQVPLSKMRIIPYFQIPGNGAQRLKSFRIIGEDGVKYDFEEPENTSSAPLSSSTYLRSGYFGVSYTTAWSLTKIISPFNTDTIRFTYTKGGHSGGFRFPQFAYYVNGVRSVYPSLPAGTSTYSVNHISSIDFPDKTKLEFVYSWDKNSTDHEFAISKIKVKDTIFRYGYLLDYDTSYITPNPRKPIISREYSTKLLLRSLTPFTPTEMQQGYRFVYRKPYFPLAGGYEDTIQNKRDHWGFYNAAHNRDSVLPKLPGYFGGADREANTEATANALQRVYYPTGGYVEYFYENNERYPYTSEENTVQITPSTTTSQHTISLNQVFNSKHRLQFMLDRTVSRSGSAPISGSGDFNISIKNTSGTITYATKTLSVYTLFQQGMQQWSFNLPNGSYRLETTLASGTSISGSFPVNVNWENKKDTALYGIFSGGIRLFGSVTYADSAKIPVRYQRVIYELENGKSSGFLGEVPKYDYAYRKTDGAAITDYMLVQAEPIAYNEYVQGSPVGYSRVVVKEGYLTSPKKTVYEFTDLSDVNADLAMLKFPYLPQDARSWGLGLPKKTFVYDSTGRLIKKTINQYQLDTVEYASDPFKALKLGLAGSSYSGSTLTGITTVGTSYYPRSGRMYLTKSLDTMYHLNGSYSANSQDYEYDAYYNVKKVTGSYDRSRGIVMEVKNYYPYDFAAGGAIQQLKDSGIINVPIASEKWLTGDGNTRLISGSISSFKSISNGMIKPDTLFTFESNKPIQSGNLSGFDSTQLNPNRSYYKAQVSYVSYNAKGMPLEIKDLNSGISSAIVMDYNDNYAVAKVSNAKYADVAYTSFESDGSGGWTIASTARNLLYNMTGKKSYALDSGSISKTGLNISVIYLVTLWARQGASVSVNGSSLTTSIASHNSWNLYQVQLTSITSVTISGSGLVDEVRLHPKDANMATTTYEPLVGVSSASDANNGIVYNEYDKLHRPKLVRDIDRNIVKKMQYSDSNLYISLQPKWVGIAAECSGNWGAWDSLYLDMNPFSDSAGYVKHVYQRLECSCPSISSNPQYKVVDGTCEMGTWAASSTVYKKVLVDGYLQWRWVCTYRYCFSDGSSSDYYSESILESPCSLNCVNY